MNATAVRSNDATVTNLSHYLLTKAGGPYQAGVAMLLLGLFAAAAEKDLDGAALLLAKVLHDARIRADIFPREFAANIDNAANNMRSVAEEALSKPEVQTALERTVRLCLKLDPAGNPCVESIEFVPRAVRGSDAAA